MKTCELLSFPQIKYYVGMGAHRVLVSLPDFKSGVAAQKVAGWVRFPHAPAKKILSDDSNSISRKIF